MTRIFRFLSALSCVNLRPIFIQEQVNIVAYRYLFESYFRLQPGPYTGWDSVQTSPLDDLLQFFAA
ncbi:MAG: hypothetical protein GY803_00260 [Chloroflexi bacterium]|nr:hypothetical protein [Chloroflexota bacterium]